MKKLFLAAVLLLSPIAAVLISDGDRSLPDGIEPLEVWPIAGEIVAGKPVLLFSSGKVVVVNPTTGEETLIVPDNVRILRKSGDIATMIRRHDGAEDSAKRAEILQWDGQRLTTMTPPDTSDDIGMLEGGAAPILFSDTALWRYIPSEMRWVSAPLSGERMRGGPRHVLRQLSTDMIFLGYEHGEWGGGLQKLNLRTGVVSNVERAVNKCVKGFASDCEPCGKPLDSDCDPVTDLAIDPSRPNCILATVGLVHMMASGRLLRICGDDISAVADWESFSSSAAAAYGVIGDKNRLWIVTGGGCGASRAAARCDIARTAPHSLDNSS